jgi:hypothetical protein
MRLAFGIFLGAFLDDIVNRTIAGNVEWAEVLFAFLIALGLAVTRRQ